MGKMQQTKANKKIDSFCNELESLSSKMAESFSLGDYNIIKTIDNKRKLILHEISKDLGNLSNNNRRILKLIWSNNNCLVSSLEEKIRENKNKYLKKKKLFIAYSKNSNI